MNKLPILIFMLLVCSMFISSDCQKHTDIKCSSSSSCYEPCRGVTGRAHGKCMNGRCTCYY
uniref:Potassium channel toxin alpha-KTx 12.5 n=1 Tax=Lychas mucronatus TaxID=172552 RepID=KA125_LYCMC|nr:RecName: Full=Potassium channel toxin alpha-KTx 12.5; AltName: Full=Toxin alpha-KTx10; Short=LmKTx10; Flags: Precursor [Lychas mucronatus]ABY26665.1 neurotoxin KTx10 [Lychas mucronatus]